MPSPDLFSITIRDLAVDRGGQTVIERADLTLTALSRLAVVGPNGVGKSSLFAAIAGQLPLRRGSVRAAPSTATVGVLRQELDGTDRSVRNHIRFATGVTDAERALADATTALADGRRGADDLYDRALDHWLRIGAADFDTRLEATAGEAGLESRLLDLSVLGLSGGQASRVGLLTMSMSAFDLTLLDEPTNGLDEAGLDALDRWIEHHRGGLAVISHDRAFLERIATSVLEIDEHTATTVVFHGGWASFVEERDRARQRAQDEHDRAVAERDRLRARAQRQREWADQGASRETKRPRDGDKNIRRRELARIDKLGAKAHRAQSAADELEVPDAPWDGWDLRFEIADGPRSATIVAWWDGVVVERGDWRVGPFDLEIRWSDRVLLAGANGSGKTSLIDALLGDLELAVGTVGLGSGVIVGRLDQRRSRLIGPEPLLDVFRDETGLDATEARSVLAKFGLGAADVDRVAGLLSPGERTRAQLAAFQAAEVNFLILDEPTNHLDLPAIEQLEAAIGTYTGTLLVVSHDRRFRDAVTIDRTVELD